MQYSEEKVKDLHQAKASEGISLQASIGSTEWEMAHIRPRFSYISPIQV